MDPTAIVTGGGRGIGLETARQLADHGFRVVVLARDPARAADPCAEAGADLVVGDLSDTATTRAAADALAAVCPRIDVLVHNAGIWPAERRLNADGVEQAFATNHLAPFLLNHLLAGNFTAGTRVVQVGAGLYVRGRADVERTATGADFHPVRTYADTKLANLALVPLFAAAWQSHGVTINAVHPGVIRTGLGERPGLAGLALRTVKRAWKPPAAGARPVTRLATDPGLAGVTGRYVEVDREKAVQGPAADPAVARRYWDQAVRLTGVPATG